MIHNMRLTYHQDLSVGGKDCRNLLIRGDNKEVLPELIPTFGGKVKCVYIDPPYNNGDSYHYYNDKAPHDTWLQNIRETLMLLKMLLRKDGSVWISIDDKEMAYLKIECDKIFGRDNFAGTIVWRQRKSRENRALFSCNHEYVLVYAREIKSFKRTRNLLPVDNDFIGSKYKNPDRDPRGPWQSVTASVQAGHAVPSQFYTIVSPTGLRHQPPQGRCWVYNEERMKREIEQGNIWFGPDGRNAPRIKKFLSHAKVGLTPETLWIDDEIGTTDSAKKHLLSLFPNVRNVFDTPKPEGLIKRILDIATNEGDYVLDCYLGSGTTIAAAHKMHRNYIGIEEGTQMTSLVVKRLKHVILGESGGISKLVGWQGGGGFAYYDFDKDRDDNSQMEAGKQAETTTNTHRPKYKQLNFFDLFDQYTNKPIVENDVLREELGIVDTHLPSDFIESKNCLISLVKKDNFEQYMNQTAKIYYTGKRFPSSVALNKLFYFMPYLKGKGIRDLYLIKIARVGSRKEGQAGEDRNDLRLVFEIEFVKQLFQDFVPVELKIWRTFTDTTLNEVLKLLEVQTTT